MAPTRLLPATLTILLAFTAPAVLGGQKVLIKGATRADVVREVDSQIGSQGFRLEDSTKREARWGMDRGLVNQTAAGGVVQSVPVVLELYVRFKDKPDGLEVTADEEVVGARGQRMEFRKPVQSSQERASMQQLLELVKTNIEARRSP